MANLALRRTEQFDIDEIDATLAEASLAEFIRIGWKWIDPATFIDNWHIDVVAEHLEAVARGEIRRLIVNIPPRHMKSLLCSVAFNAWVWAQAEDDRYPNWGPGTAFLTLSYAQSLSIRDSVKTRRLIKSPWYQAMFGDRFSISADQDAKMRFENNHNGYRLASSVDGAATGEGGDVIVIDDAINAKDALSAQVRGTTNDWFDNTMPTRLNNPKTGAFVIIMQRLHEDDLVGHILDTQPDDWTHVCLPARYERAHPHPFKKDRRKKEGQLLWPDRFGEPEIRRLEKPLGSYGAAGQLQQRPAPREGGLLKPEWFRFFKRIPHDVMRVVRAWDFAATEPEPGTTPDWTVGIRMVMTQRQQFIITGCVRFQGSPMTVETRLVQQAHLDGYDTRVRIPQDPGQAGKAQAESFTKKLLGFAVSSERPTGDKATRAGPFAAAAEAGDVFILRTGDPERDAWIQTFFDEMEVFPYGRHDDQVDAVADAFNELTQGRASMFDTE